MYKHLFRGIFVSTALLFLFKTEKIQAQAAVSKPDSVFVVSENAFKSFLADFTKKVPGYDTIKNLESAQNHSFIYTSQLMEGRLSGVSMLRESGEPGIAPTVLIRGNTVPFGRSASAYENQPLYVVNGIPLLANNNPYLLSAKANGSVPGSGINMMGLQNLNNIDKIAVLKGSEAVAIYGPLASNGAIIITTNKPEAGQYKINLETYGGVSLGSSAIYKKDFFPTNGAFESKHYLDLYNRFAKPEQWALFPAYLADSTSEVYFGAADWGKSYYGNGFNHGVALDISGGNERANFRFGVSERTEQGVADNTSLERYSVFYDMTMIPVEKLTFNIFAQGSIANRQRNKMLRERFAEQEFIPELEYPLPPNRKYLNAYNELLNNQIDKNGANSLQVQAKVQYALSQALSLNTGFSVDYNDDFRDVFFPAAVNDGNSYSSYFTGVNRRILLDNFAIFQKKIASGHKVNVRVGQSLMADALKYDYIQGYRGPSDFIKIIKVDEGTGTWETHNKEFVYRYKDFLKHNLLSFYGNGTYSFLDKYWASLSLRNDGSSYFGNGYNWALSSMGTLGWKLTGENWLQPGKVVDKLSLKLSAGKTSILPSTDYYSNGPYYSVDVGWNGSENVSSYNSVPALGLPFSAAYVGGGIKMASNHTVEAGVDATLFGSLELSLAYYSRRSKDLLIEVPVDMSYGFSKKIMNGMDVRNQGVELGIYYKAALSKNVQLSSSFNLTYNSNRLMSLPNGLEHAQFGSSRLEVGKPVDQFWVLETRGIYETDDQVPASPSGKKLTYNGVALHAGDPVWTDINQDYTINDDDKVMKGHKLPPLFGGWTNSLHYKNYSLDFSFVYHLGNSMLNAGVANRLNIAGNANDLNHVKETSYWIGSKNYDNYPKFNPWSMVDPYQTDQTVFLEKAGFVKLNSVSLRYDLGNTAFVQKANISKLQVYVSAVNLFRLTPYSGLYPELGGTDGYDYGYKMPLPLTVSFGINATFK